MKFCVHCGNVINDEANFCGVCGKNQINQQSEPQIENTKPQVEYGSNTFNTQAPPINQPFVPVNFGTNQPKKKSNAALISIVVVLSVLVVAIGVIIALYLSGVITFGVGEETRKTGSTLHVTTTTELEVETTTTVETTTAPPVTTAMTTTTPSVNVPDGVWGPSVIYNYTFTGTVVNTNGHGLLMRVGPGTSYDKIKNGSNKNVNLPDGSIVTVLGTDYEGSNWYYVEYNGMYGWCCRFADNTTYIQ